MAVTTHLRFFQYMFANYYTLDTKTSLKYLLIHSNF